MSLIPDPQLSVLHAQIESLTADLTELIARKDELLGQICPRIAAQYMMAVGALECDAYRLDCRMRRLRRKLALIRIRVNRQEPVDLVWIEVQLVEEFAKFEQEVRRQQERLAELHGWMQLPELSDADSEELRTKYRLLVKRLHPDTNPNAAEKDVLLFTQCAEAYRRGDLGTIRLLFAMLAAENPSITPQYNDLETLMKRRDYLAERKQAFQDTIATIENSFPYNEQDFLSNPYAVDTRVKQVKSEIESLQVQIRWYTQQLSRWEEAP